MRVTAAVETDRRIHAAREKPALNPPLIPVYESGRNIFVRLPFYWKLFREAEVKNVRAARHELARGGHEQILKGIEEDDAAEAEGAMFQHLDIMEKGLLNRLQGNGSGDKASYSHPVLANFANTTL